MPNSSDKFHSPRGKRLVLVADDEIINREILSVCLEESYEVLTACDGGEALRLMREYKNTLSLVLLDVLMPVMTGLEVLKQAKADPELSHIPIIVVTTEQSAEVESLKLGAIDFIPKPYPAVDVILARVLRTIELSEDRDIILSTERDTLTGLYNKEYFYRYGAQYDQFHPELATDAVLIDVNHFHMINERYGKAYGDEVLKRIGEKVREMVQESGGIVCRREADTFLVYCPHREDYEEILENASVDLSGEVSANNRVRLRMGVYSNVDKSIELERRFDRAKLAADSVRGSFTKTIGFYDDTLHSREIYAEQLIEDFPAALAEHQFLVYYQPKFDIRPATPILSSAEALVRWNHPKLGLISPGIFIPLFEGNGLIQQLDSYVWEETARQIRAWKDRYDFSVPISVNVSRIDMYDPRMVDNLLALLDRYGLQPRELLLEVTESAYTQDSEQIVERVKQLRELGFQIEMDDFGTGYSSLNMISDLPIDALKLDMQFIRSAFKEGGNTHILEIIIGIANYLSAPVIAEGVETEEQLNALKQLGCDIVQGYFFSRPVPAQDFEPFIKQRKEAIKAGLAHKASPDPGTAAESPHPLGEAAGEKQPTRRRADVSGRTGSPGSADTSASPRTAVHTGMQLRTANIFFVILAFLAALGLFISDLAVTRGYRRMEHASDRYIAAQLAAGDMESGSDYLTDRVRCFVVTGETEYLNDFFEELETTRTRDNAVESLKSLLGNSDSDAIRSLSAALELSNELVNTELLAMRLTLEAGDYDRLLIPEKVTGIQLGPEYTSLSADELHKRAEMLVFDSAYMHFKDRIRENVSQCTQALIYSSSQELEEASSRMDLLMLVQTAVTVLFLLIVLAIVVIISTQIRMPLTKIVQMMQEQVPIPPMGVEELRFVTRTYNTILQENQAAKEKLSHEASHDPLTGLFNRSAYELLLSSADTSHMALIIVDVDHFKSVNDTYGHGVGDRVLKRVAEVLQGSFRSVDIICRYGGDEFVIVMTRANSSMSQLVLNKIAAANELLMHPKDDLPPVSLSVGVAFSDRKNPQGDIFTDADTALYRVKDAGKCGCCIYE